MAVKLFLIYCITLIALGGCTNHEFTYEIRNMLKPPMFKVNLTLEITNGTDPLIRYMERFVDTHAEFTSFVAKYSASFGYYISEVNGVTETYSEDKSFWALKDGRTDTFLSLGVGSYIPKANDYIVLNLEIDSFVYNTTTPKSDV